jgi:hypothetical protein
LEQLALASERQAEAAGVELAERVGLPAQLARWVDANAAYSKALKRLRTGGKRVPVRSSVAKQRLALPPREPPALHRSPPAPTSTPRRAGPHSAVQEGVVAAEQLAAAVQPEE